VSQASLLCTDQQRLIAITVITFSCLCLLLIREKQNFPHFLTL